MRGDAWDEMRWEICDGPAVAHLILDELGTTYILLVDSHRLAGAVGELMADLERALAAHDRRITKLVHANRAHGCQRVREQGGVREVWGDVLRSVRCGEIEAVPT